MLAGTSALFFLSGIASSAQIAAWDFTGQGGNQASTPASLSAAGTTASAITRGSGLSTNAGSGSINSTGFTTAATLDSNDYYEFSVSINPGTSLDIDSISFAERRSGTGIRTFSLRSSLDSYATDAVAAISVPDDTNTRDQTLTLGSAFDAVTAPTITFRIYGYAAEGSAGSWRIANHSTKLAMTIEGTVNTSGGGGPDTTPPVVAALAPADGATAVNENADLVITFNETIQKGTGSILIKRTSDSSTAQTIDVATDAVTVVGTTATINPPTALAFATGYYVEFAAGVFRDTATTPNNFAGFSTPTTWNFTTRDAPAPNALFITQYYEGTSFNKFIELYNNGTSEIDLSTYSLTLWSNANAEAWKTGGSASATLALSGTLAPGAYCLLSHSSAATPGDIISGSVINFNGDDSVVLYANAEIVDAIPFTDLGNEGADKSFYRISFDQGYDTSAGSSVLSFPAVWAEKSLEDVASATTTDAWYLQRKTTPPALTISFDTSSAPENTLNAATATVTRSGSTTGALIVEISFNDATEVEAPFEVTIPDGLASATFPINTLDDSIPDSIDVTFTATSPGYVSGTATFTVNDDGDVLPPAPVGLKINEIRIDDDGNGVDGFEYFELYNSSSSPVSLNNVAYVVVGDGTANSGTVENITLLPNVTIPAGGFYLVANPTSMPIDRNTDGDQDTDFTVTPAIGDAGLVFENSYNVTHILVYGYTGTTNSDVDSNDDGTLNLSLPWVSVLDAISLVETVETAGSALSGSTNEYYYATALGGVDVGPDVTFTPAHVYRAANGTGAWTIGLFGADQDLLPGGDNSVLADVQDTPGSSNVVSASNFSTWASSNGATNDALADHDGDGVRNGVEYFMGQTGSSFTTMPSVVNGSITWAKDSSANATYVVKTSTDFVTWTAATSGVVDNGTSVVYTLPTGLAKIFARLEVTIP
jgi:hypothetical protein